MGQKVKVEIEIPAGYRYLGVKKGEDLGPEDLVVAGDGTCKARQLCTTGLNWPYVIVEECIAKVGDWVRIPGGSVCHQVKMVVLGSRNGVELHSGIFVEHGAYEIMDRLVEALDFEAFCRLVGEFGKTLIDPDGDVFSIIRIDHNGVDVRHPAENNMRGLAFEFIKDWYIGRKDRAKLVGKASFRARFNGGQTGVTG